MILISNLYVSQLIRKLKPEKTSPPTPPCALPAEPSSDAEPSGNVQEGKKLSSPTGWWENYEKKDIIAWDTEQVTKVENGQNKQHVATVDVVDYNKVNIFSRKIYHKTGSFKINTSTQFINGFKSNDFDDPKLPTEMDVRNEIKKLFKDKLVISLGGISDYEALGLEIADFDNFELQSHWFVEGTDCNTGLPTRQPHSLRSLVKYYQLHDPQKGKRGSHNDAVAHMELYHVYEKIKSEDHPGMENTRYNNDRPYNEIPVVPNPIKLHLQNKRKGQPRQPPHRPKMQYSPE